MNGMRCLLEQRVNRGDAIRYPQELASPLREPVVTLEQVRTVEPRPPTKER